MSEVAVWLTFKKCVEELEGLLATGQTRQPEDRQKVLLVVLNRLELACLNLPDVEPTDGGDSPNTYDARRAQVSSAFPEFGWYHHVRPSHADEEEQVGLGDPLDDLADILRDIDDALWTETNRGMASAIWQAKFNYEHHFGSHISDLRSYLYRLRFFGP